MRAFTDHTSSDRRLIPAGLADENTCKHQIYLLLSTCQPPGLSGLPKSSFLNVMPNRFPRVVERVHWQDEIQHRI